MQCDKQSAGQPIAVRTINSRLVQELCPYSLQSLLIMQHSQRSRVHQSISPNSYSHVKKGKVTSGSKAPEAPADPEISSGSIGSSHNGRQNCDAPIAIQWPANGGSDLNGRDGALGAHPAMFIDLLTCLILDIRARKRPIRMLCFGWTAAGLV